MKKIFAVLFACVILFSLCALSVFANVETVNGAETTAAAEAAEAVEAADEAEKAAEDKGFMFEPMNFIYNLKYMGVGMLCIIIVIGVLIGVTIVLNKVTAPKK